MVRAHGGLQIFGQLPDAGAHCGHGPDFLPVRPGARGRALCSQIHQAADCGTQPRSLYCQIRDLTFGT